MVVVFEASRYRSPLDPGEARELAERLRGRAGDALSPAAVVAAKIEQALDAPTEGGAPLRLPDTETDALAWAIYEWLDEVGIDELPPRIVRLRDALDAESRVAIEVRGSIYLLRRYQATRLAENLRRKAAGQLGSEGVEDAREVADAIEAVLTAASEGPVRLSDLGAEAVFYVLDVGLGDPKSPVVAEAYSLYQGARQVRNEVHGLPDPRHENR